MQSNIIHSWLNKRGITDDVIALFNISVHDHPQIGECIKIPYSETHAKYRRHPNDDRKPKYLYDAGGKVTLYGADKVNWKQPIVITEGELDTLVCWSHNLQAVSSTGGAASWQATWGARFHIHTKKYICFDNDDAGGSGMVKVLESIPDAHIIFIPDLPGVKDISDYVTRGGDLHQLLKTAKQFNSLEEVEEDMRKREAVWQSVHFHKAYINKHQQDLHKTNYTPQTYDGNDQMLRAKTYPLPNLLEFNRGKALCPFHNENTPSVHFYKKTNSAYCFGCGKKFDSIDMYQEIHGVSFKEAVESLCKLL